MKKVLVIISLIVVIFMSVAVMATECGCPFLFKAQKVLIKKDQREYTYVFSTKFVETQMYMIKTPIGNWVVDLDNTPIPEGYTSETLWGSIGI